MKLFAAALLFAAAESALQPGSPFAVLWTGPCIILASLMIAWGAEATQFFLAQGIALAVLALLQTLPEFAVEAVLAWHQEVPYLLANLTGALMLLTGLGWPLIYFAAAGAYRREHGRPMRRIVLQQEQSVQIFALFISLGYEFVVWWKGSLNLIDTAILLFIYVAWLLVMRRLPPEEPETLDDIGRIPRAIVLARKPLRIAAILGLFIAGGIAVFMIADPFLSGLFGLSTLLGVSSFQFIQWIAPVVSETPEGVSAFYWARDYERASIALMNLVSSNINQWTLLAAMLPVVLSVSIGAPSAIPIDAVQSRELILALSQGLLGAMFLVNMEVAWWEAAGLLVLFIVQLIFSAAGASLHRYITWIYLGWSAVEALRILTGSRKTHALKHFADILKKTHA